MSKKIWTILIGVGLIVLGTFLVIDPNQTTQNLIYYLGVALLVIGILKIISGIVNKENKTYLTSTISNGVLNILLGIILMTTTTLTIKVISIFIGIYLIISSSSELLFRFNFGSIMKNNMYVQIIKLILGVIVLTTPVITIVFSGLVMGIILIIIGVYTLINMKDDEEYKVKIK